MNRPFVAIVFLVLITCGLTLPAAAQKTDSNLANIPSKYHPQLNKVVKEFKKNGFDLDSLLSDNRFEVYGSIGHKFTHSAERKTPSLSDYKKLLGFTKKIAEGVGFIKAHKKQLEKAQDDYGISRYVITAVLGIESNYGSNIGSYNPFNVYVSMLVVGYRTDFAKDQLENLLKFTTRKKLDVLALKSSYAGAMSYAQFTPYSVNRYWVGDKVFDMKNSILSVANYLHHFKKRSGSISTAVMRYNPSSLYRDFVLDLSKAIQKRYEKIHKTASTDME